MEYAGETLEVLMGEIGNGTCAYCEFTTIEIRGDYMSPMITHMKAKHARVLPTGFSKIRVERKA